MRLDPAAAARTAVTSAPAAGAVAKMLLREAGVRLLGFVAQIGTVSMQQFDEAEIEENIVRFLEGREVQPAFDGHANCFIETGFGKALLIDFNYEVEPLPGKFPVPVLGPMSLMEESRINHLGKLAFKWVYWNILLKGGEMPFESQMSMAGKWK